MRTSSLWLIFALAVGAVAKAQDIDIPYQNSFSIMGSR